MKWCYPDIPISAGAGNERHQQKIIRKWLSDGVEWCVCVYFTARVYTACMANKKNDDLCWIFRICRVGDGCHRPLLPIFFFLSRCSSVGIGWASQLRNVSALERHLKNEPFRKINLFRASAESMQEKSPIPSCFNKIPIKEITPAGYTSICEVSLVLFRASFPFVMLPSCRQLDSGAMPNQNPTTESRSSAYFFFRSGMICVVNARRWIQVFVAPHPTVDCVQV